MSLVVHYMFNEIVNGKIPDVSGNGNDITIDTNSKCYLVDNIDTKNTKYSKCLYSVNGSIGKLSKEEYFISEKTGTVSLFVKNDDNDYSNLLYTYPRTKRSEISTPLVTKPRPDQVIKPLESAFLIINDTSVGCGTICFGHFNSKEYRTYGQFSGFVSNKFNHLAFTYDAINLKFLIYVNGILFLNVPASSEFKIYKCNTLALGYSKGSIVLYTAKPGYWSDFRYYDNVLTAQEIKKIYDDYYAAPQKPASFKITKASQMISNEFIERTPGTSTKISIYEKNVQCTELIENLNQNVPKMTKTGNLMCKEFVEKA